MYWIAVSLRLLIQSSSSSAKRFIDASASGQGPYQRVRLMVAPARWARSQDLRNDSAVRGSPLEIGSAPPSNHLSRQKIRTCWGARARTCFSYSFDDASSRSLGLQ